MRPLDRKWFISYDNALAIKDKSIITLDPYRGWALEFEVKAWRDQCEGTFRATNGVDVISKTFPFKVEDHYFARFGYALYHLERKIAEAK